VVADNELVELVSQSRTTNRRALARASATVSAFDLLMPSVQPKQRSEAKMNRARSSGRRLSVEDAAKVKAMLQRGDRHHDIAAWFGVNQGRIAEVRGRELFPEVSPARPEELPPQGSPGRIALISIKALEGTRNKLAAASQALEDAIAREDAGGAIAHEAVRSMREELQAIEAALDEINKETE
jgi:hypothetical protein